MRTWFGPFSLFGGFAGSAVITMVLGALPVPYWVAIGILCIFVFAWSARSPVRGAVATLVCAALFADGFLVNGLGRLRWNGRIDVEWFAVLAGAVLLGLACRHLASVLRYQEPVFRPVERTFPAPALTIRPHRST